MVSFAFDLIAIFNYFSLAFAMWTQLDSDVKAAFDVAYDNIYVFHAAQRKTQQLQVETMPVSVSHTPFNCSIAYFLSLSFSKKL
jgi:hypothetical protein